jgi:uncharacterized membrane protein YqaE (UPF0057 family)
MKLFKLLLGAALPPIGIIVTYGFGTRFLLSLGLTALGWIPGSIYAVWAIAKQEAA